jgi:sec-independent protein translocase protein TatB
MLTVTKDCNTFLTSKRAANALISWRKLTVASLRLGICDHWVGAGIIKNKMSLPDTIFIFALALVIFGPKKLPEIGRQIGKLVFEFRRASNEFKLQIEEELRAAENADRQKKLAAESEAVAAAPVTAKEAMTVRPPSTGTIVSTEAPAKAFASPDVSTDGLESSNSIHPDPLFLEDGSESEGIKQKPETEPAAAADLAGAPAIAAEPAALLNPESDSGLDHQPIEDVNTAIVAAPAQEVTGSRLEAAQKAEEHIREQIAIHHG